MVDPEPGPDRRLDPRPNDLSLLERRVAGQNDVRRERANIAGQGPDMQVVDGLDSVIGCTKVQLIVNELTFSNSNSSEKNLLTGFPFSSTFIPKVIFASASVRFVFLYGVIRNINAVPSLKGAIIAFLEKSICAFGLLNLP